MTYTQEVNEKEEEDKEEDKTLVALHEDLNLRAALYGILFQTYADKVCNTLAWLFNIIFIIAN